MFSTFFKQTHHNTTTDEKKATSIIPDIEIKKTPKEFDNLIFALPWTICNADQSWLINTCGTHNYFLDLNSENFINQTDKPNTITKFILSLKDNIVVLCEENNRHESLTRYRVEKNAKTNALSLIPDSKNSSKSFCKLSPTESRKNHYGSTYSDMRGKNALARKVSLCKYNSDSFLFIGETIKNEGLRIYLIENHSMKILKRLFLPTSAAIECSLFIFPEKYFIYDKNTQSLEVYQFDIENEKITKVDNIRLPFVAYQMWQSPIKDNIIMKTTKHQLINCHISDNKIINFTFLDTLVPAPSHTIYLLPNGCMIYKAGQYCKLQEKIFESRYGCMDLINGNKKYFPCAEDDQLFVTALAGFYRIGSLSTDNQFRTLTLTTLENSEYKVDEILKRDKNQQDVFLTIKNSLPSIPEEISKIIFKLSLDQRFFKECNPEINSFNSHMQETKIQNEINDRLEELDLELANKNSDYEDASRASNLLKQFSTKLLAHPQQSYQDCLDTLDIKILTSFHEGLHSNVKSNLHVSAKFLQEITTYARTYISPVMPECSYTGIYKSSPS